MALADIIVSNPPYLDLQDLAQLQTEVQFEPLEALYGGDDGMAFYEAIPKLWSSRLKKGGHLLFEVGIGQSARVAKILRENGFSQVRELVDLCGIKRVVDGVKD